MHNRNSINTVFVFLPWGSCEQPELSANGRPATADKWPHHLEWAGQQGFLGWSGSSLCSPTVCELFERRPRTLSSNMTPDPEREQVWCELVKSVSAGKLQAGDKKIYIDQEAIRVAYLIVSGVSVFFFSLILCKSRKRRDYPATRTLKIFVTSCICGLVVFSSHSDL